MEPSRKLIRPRPWQILVFILLLCLVILCARFCAFQARTYIQEKAEDAAVWILQEQTITRGFGLQLIDNQLRYAASFGLGLTDAMIRFENIPHDPRDVFISLWKAMNPGILVEKIEFLDHAVRITLTSSSYTSLEQYQAVLSKETFFSNVLLHQQPTAEQQVKAAVVCLFA